MSARVVFGALASLLLLPTVPADSIDHLRPLVVVATVANSSASVTWVPGPEWPESYHVYGATGDALILLATIQNGTTARVPGGFESYAVSAVAGMRESELVYAIRLPSVCVGIVTNPPEVIVGCLDKDPIRVKVTS